MSVFFEFRFIGENVNQAELIMHINITVASNSGCDACEMYKIGCDPTVVTAKWIGSKGNHRIKIKVIITFNWFFLMVV